MLVMINTKGGNGGAWIVEGASAGCNLWWAESPLMTHPTHSNPIKAVGVVQLVGDLVAGGAIRIINWRENWSPVQTPLPALRTFFDGG